MSARCGGQVVSGCCGVHGDKAAASGGLSASNVSAGAEHAALPADRVKPDADTGSAALAVGSAVSGFVAESAPRVFAYDFDGTIYDGDSSVDFLVFCARRHPTAVLGMLPRFAAASARFAAGRDGRAAAGRDGRAGAAGVQTAAGCDGRAATTSARTDARCGDRTQLKEAYFSFLRSIPQLDAIVSEFWDAHWEKMRVFLIERPTDSLDRPRPDERVAHHPGSASSANGQADASRAFPPSSHSVVSIAGDSAPSSEQGSPRIIIVASASPSFLLAPACERLGVTHLIASEVDPATGRFLSPNCRGWEKAARLRALMRELGIGRIDAFYSDSVEADGPAAQLAAQAWLVGRDGALFPWPTAHIAQRDAELNDAGQRDAELSDAGQRDAELSGDVTSASDTTKQPRLTT